MRLILTALLWVALATAAPAMAQPIPSYSYPSAGTPPSVFLQCNDALTACTPITSTNPLRTSSGTGAAAQQVQGTEAENVANDNSGPVKMGCISGAGAGTPPVLPTIATGLGRSVGTRCGVQGQQFVSLVDGGGFILTTNYVGADSVSGFGPALKVYGPAMMQSGSALIPLIGDYQGLWTIGRGGASLATAQISVGTTAVLLAAARSGRQKITISVGAANACAYGGASNITNTTGFALQPVAGATSTLDYAGNLYAVCSATTTISVAEQY